jgi:hypothetical protein
MSVFQETVLAAESTSCRGTGLKVAMNRKGREVPDGPCKLTESDMEGQANLPLKALTRKTASKCGSLIYLR